MCGNELAWRKPSASVAAHRQLSRWMDVNKGDDDCPDIRSRIVARQIRGANEDPMLAPTPPLEALRTVFGYCATDMDGEKPKCRDGRSPNRIQLSLIDISGAYFHSRCDPAKPNFVALPTEDRDYRSVCGLLCKHMYGTQAAADGWQVRYSTFRDLDVLSMQCFTVCVCVWVFRHGTR